MDYFRDFFFYILIMVFGVYNVISVVVLCQSYVLTSGAWHCTSYSYEKRECIVYSKEK